MEQPRGPIFSSPVVTRAARWGVVAWSVIGVAIIGYLAYRYLLYPVRIIFPPLGVALIIVYLLNPVVSRLERRGLPRIWGTLATYLLFLTVVGFALAYLIPLVSQQVGGFVKSLPDLLDRVRDGIVDLGARVGVDISGDQLLSSEGQTRALDFLGRITSITVGVLHVALIMVLGPILAFYLLVDLPKMRRGIQALIPARRRAEAQVLGERLSAAVGGFFRGQLLVALFVGIASMAGLYIVGLPYWALVGLLTGLFNLIPLIGPFIGGAVAVLIAFTTEQPAAGLIIHPEPGWPLAVAAAVALLVVQQIDNHIISPNVVARTVKLHPVTVMLSLLAGGTLLGLWGMLLAVPTVASIKILLMHYWDTRSSWPPAAPVLHTGARPDVPPGRPVPAEPQPVPASPPGAAEGPPRARESAAGPWWRLWRARPARRRKEAERQAPSSASTASAKPSPAGEGTA